MLYCWRIAILHLFGKTWAEGKWICMGMRRKNGIGKKSIELRGFDDFDVSLGDKMRGIRATLGKSLDDVGRDLKINVKYIQAI